MGENGLELTWEERREQRRQRRNVLSESDRCIPNDNDITERKLKAQKRTEECKRENAKFEKQLKEEDEARIQRQKKREQKRVSREFDSDYIQKVNEDLMSRITAAPSPDFTEPPRRRRSVVTRRSRGSIRKERSVSNGDDIQRSVSDYNDVNSTFSSASRTSKVRGDSNSSNSMVSTNGLQLELSGNPKTMTDRLPSDTDVVDMLHIRSTKMNADVQFDNETAVKKNVEEATDENFNGTTKMEIELPQNSSQEIESNETNITDTTSNDLPTKTADISESEPTNIYQEEVEEIIVAERITEPKIEPTPEASGNDYKKNDDHAIEPTPTAKPTPTTKPESDEEVASVNGRVNVHQTGPSDVSKYEEPPIEKPVGKISSIDKYKQNYMKKADAPMSGNCTPNSEVTMTPPGTMSLRERMKMFEKKGNPDRIHPRETVTQSERASNIRNKISLWGKSDSGGNSLANQREKIHVGSIDERRNQYSTLAKI